MRKSIIIKVVAEQRKLSYANSNCLIEYAATESKSNYTEIIS